MSRSLTELLAEADQIIEKRAGVKPETADQSDEVVKLASMLGMDEPVQPVAEEKFEMNLFEKVAHSLAIAQTVSMLGQLEKLAQFKAAAIERGWTEEQVDEYLEKKAAMPSPKKVLMPAAMLALGGAGSVAAYKKGKNKGYGKAQQDMQQAIEQYAEQLGE